MTAVKRGSIFLTHFHNRKIFDPVRMRADVWQELEVIPVYRTTNTVKV